MSDFDIELRLASYADVKNVIALQSTLIRDRINADGQTGFLISKFCESELAELLNNGSELILTENKNGVIGYILLTEFREFESVLLEARNLDIKNFDNLKNVEPRYLYQIGVSPESRGKGIAKSLLEFAKTRSPQGIITDVLTGPVKNDVSISFFHKNNFLSIGSFSLAAYRDFGQLDSLVLTWKPQKN